MQVNYYAKYLKYKQKYLDLKEEMMSVGGAGEIKRNPKDQLPSLPTTSSKKTPENLYEYQTDKSIINTKCKANGNPDRLKKWLLNTPENTEYPHPFNLKKDEFICKEIPTRINLPADNKKLCDMCYNNPKVEDKCCLGFAHDVLDLSIKK